ncbi:tetratricopeptide repeat protein [Streptomyces sp. HUAS TT20]|uniref:tetratricopeptide repeat protein n=1 Tax=Streptomyces sp. HUAS TT20 TaxID=3447509 RepID=UPI0021D7EB2F|nr:tetratricopeptide repeat protein [Streptomyces sp. HUAS 15-9]UXY32397.1 tetratricopeptide repeat protein [Streptomyces sp. HUAS 15-9]
MTPPVADLTAQFRKQLSETSLYPPPGVPEPPAESVLDLVGDIDPDPKRLGASMMRFLARLRPKIAYRVRGELQVRNQEPRYGMTVTVTSYALGGCRMTTVWGSNWEEAVSSAAYWVVASLLPVTRAGKHPPWRDWVGRELPSELFEAFQRGSLLHKDHKNDEAMDWYHKALRLDPLNPYLRFKLSRVQEECGLYIDALDMIQGSLIFDGQREDDYTWRLWQSFRHLRRPSYLLHLRRRPRR